MNPVPRLRFCPSAYAIEELPRTGAALGSPRACSSKRDDQTGLAFGA